MCIGKPDLGGSRMYALQLIPQIERSDAEVASLRNTFANPVHYDYMIEEDAVIFSPEGRVLARLVTNCLSESLVAATAAQFIKVRGDASGRPSVVGKDSMMYRLRKDGTMGHTKEVPPEIIAEMRAQNTFTDFLGWMDASKMGDRFPECRQTGWSVRCPEIHEAAGPFIEEVARVYREELPDHWLAQTEFMRGVADGWKFDDTFSTVTVNRNLRTTYHYDNGDYRGGMGNLVVLAGEEGGELVMPRFRIAFRPRPTDVLLMNVHEMHGNLPFTGERLTAVLYAREHIDQCA
jgi:hypothetical protein